MKKPVLFRDLSVFYLLDAKSAKRLQREDAFLIFFAIRLVFQ